MQDGTGGQKYETAMAKGGRLRTRKRTAGRNVKPDFEVVQYHGNCSRSDCGRCVHAISAGQKTGDAVNFVSNSTKLAKAVLLKAHRHWTF